MSDRDGGAGGCLDEFCLIGFAEGRLDSEQRLMAAKHIDACESCRRLVSSLAQQSGGDEQNEAPEHESATVVGGRYRLDRAQQPGALGNSFVAHDLHEGRPVSVKVLHRELLAEPDALDKLNQLLGRWNALDSAGLAGPCRLRQVETGYAIVRSLLDGTDLAVLTTSAPLGTNRIIDIAAQLCVALTPVHAQNLAHGDIKASNVIVDLSDHAVITDGGLAAGLAHPMLRAALATRSPEQALGKTPDPRSDVYALGQLLRFMLKSAGHELSSVPRGLADCLLRAAHTSPEERFASAAELHRSLLRRRGAPRIRVGAYAVTRDAADVVRSKPQVPLGAGTLVADRFVIEAPLGSGGMGAVYRALDHQSGAQVAVKVLHEVKSGHASRFLREARTLAQLGHPGIVVYVAHGVTNGRPYLAMEWVRGVDLSCHLAAHRLGLREAVVVVSNIAAAIGAAHQLGVVHRDLKPTNVMLPVGDDLAVKVLDFGLARYFGHDNELTRSGTVLGTPGYMAPEQARGDRGVGPTADVFALGCILFECLTGRRAFRGKNAMSIVAKIANAPRPALRGLCPHAPDDLAALVERMLHVDATERPSDGRAVADELRRIAAELPQITPDPSDDHRGLTARAKTMLSVLVVGIDGDSSAGDAEQRALIEGQARALGGKCHTDEEGRQVIHWSGHDRSSDECVHAASCAMALLDRLPTARMSLTAGYGSVHQGRPAGEVVARGRQLLDDGASGEALADDVVAHLVAPRFDVVRADDGYVLKGFKDPLSYRDRLLGVDTPFVGRGAVLSVLTTVASECFDERSLNVVLLNGPAGIGKSRIAREALHVFRQRWPTLCCWIGQGTPLRAGTTYGLLADILRYSMGIRVGDVGQVQRDAIRGHVERVVPSADAPVVGSTLGRVMGVLEAEQDAAAGLQLPIHPEVSRAFTTYLRGTCDARPLVLVVEDIHWGDLATLNLIDELLAQHAELPVLVVALARPEVRQQFPSLWADRPMQEIRVGALRSRDAKQLVATVLDEAEDHQIERIVKRADGNPFFLEELIRVAAAGADEDAPETILAMIQTRIKLLDEEALRVLRAASIFGRMFWQGGVERLLGAHHEESDTAGWLNTLVRRELIRPSSDSRLAREVQYAFQHELVRDAAYAMLTDDDRRLGHRLAGSWLESKGCNEATVLAAHYDHGVDAERAARWWQRAAQEALAGRELDLARSYAERALTHPLAVNEQAAMLYVRAEVFNMHGKLREACEVGAEAMALMDPATAMWRATVALRAELAQMLGDRDTLRDLSQALMAPSAASCDPVELAALRGKVVTNLHRAAMHPEAAALIEQTVSSVSSVSSEQQDAASEAFFGYAQHSRELPLDAKVDHFCKAARGFEEAGDRRQAARQRNNQGCALNALGAFEEARDVFEQANAIVQKLGTAYGAAIIGHNLALAVSHLGELDRGRALCEEAIAVFSSADAPWFELGARIYLAQIYHRTGQTAEALAEARRGVDLASGHVVGHVVGERAPALATLSMPLLTLGRLDEALAASTAAMDHLEAQSDSTGSDRESLVRLAHGRALWANERQVEALETIDIGAARILQVAACVSTPRYRNSFVEREPFNVEVLRLAKSRFGQP